MIYIPARPLMIHQKDALEKMEGQESFALLMEYGTGKSAVAVTDAGRLYTQGLIDGVLVLSPKGVYTDWSVENEETSHWMLNLDPSIRYICHRWRGGHTKDEKHWFQRLLGIYMERVANEVQYLSVFVVNTEALSSGGRAEAACREFLTKRKCMLIVDESTQVRSPTARRTKAVLRLSDLAKYRRILTGFPTPKSSLDLYSQFRVLDWRILGHRSYWTYKNRYAVHQPLYLGSRTIQQVVGYQNTEELWGRIAPYSFRVRADDCLDLPDQVYVRREVEMLSQTRRVYDDLVRQCTTELEGGHHVTATLAITLIMRLHQVCCGHVRDEIGELHNLECGKFDVLKEVLEEIGSEEKVVIWCHFTRALQHVRGYLATEYGHESVVIYHGDTPDDKREIAKRRFAEDPECRFFVANQATGGRGINDLVVARHAIYFSNPPDLELRLNSEARTRRRGSERHRSVVYTDLCTSNSIEERIISALRSRLDMASLVVGDKWREWLV